MVIFIGGFLILSLGIGFATMLLPDSYGENGTEALLDSLFKKILYGVFIVPVFETLLFQTLIISVICRIIKQAKYNFYPAILLSSMAFSLSHSYNLYYIIYTFIAGLILAFAYYIARYRKENATLLVFMIHSIFNLTSFGLDYI